MENKLDKITCNIFWINTYNINKKNYENSRMLSTLGFAGTATQFDATSIYRMCPSQPSTAIHGDPLYQFSVNKRMLWNEF